jgi:hypothetical protein
LFLSAGCIVSLYPFSARSGEEENAGGVSETATIEEDVVAAPNNEDEPADEPMDAQEAPSAERQREIDEYRHILGGQWKKLSFKLAEKSLACWRGSVNTTNCE